MFPTICIDNFYDNPDEIRNFALSLDYSWKAGNFPGKRTVPLEHISSYFYEQFCKRLFSIFYNFSLDDLEVSVNTHFQKIYPYSKDENDPLNFGWFHHDGGEQIAAGVIYLSPNPNPNAGTVFAEQISPVNCFLPLRDKLYKDNDISQVDVQEYRESLLNHNNCFKTNIEIKNVYNRMIFYNSNVPHRENNFFCFENEPRLTQVFFVTKFKSKKSPIDRMMENKISTTKLYSTI